ncbi:MAG: hypothetical protein WC718_13250 [Phycisphaerales bacterium]
MRGLAKIEVTLLSVLLVVKLYLSRYLPTRWLMLVLGCCAGEVVLEQLDRVLWHPWDGLGVSLVSGHTLKHLCAGAGTLLVARGIAASPVRRSVSTNSPAM